MWLLLSMLASAHIWEGGLPVVDRERTLIFIITHLPVGLNWLSALVWSRRTMHAGIRVWVWILNVWPRTLALPANGLMRGDPFAFVDWRHGSSELLLPARKSPELSVPNAHQLPGTKRSEYSWWRCRLSLPPGILNFTHVSNQTLKDCVLCTVLAYDWVSLQNCTLAISHWCALTDPGGSNHKNLLVVIFTVRLSRVWSTLTQLTFWELTGGRELWPQYQNTSYSSCLISRSQAHKVVCFLPHFGC